jgi:hypothetical protein
MAKRAVDLHGLTQALVRVVAPDSLSLDRNDDDEEGAAVAAAILRPGDLILVSTPGAFYSIARALTKHQYDHIV